MFAIINNHHSLFLRVKTSWHYLEASHRKGPCDGVGGTSKQLADIAVRTHKVSQIQDADEYYTWDNEHHREIQYVYIPKSSCEACQHAFEKKWSIMGVADAMKIHSVVLNPKSTA